MATTNATRAQNAEIVAYAEKLTRNPSTVRRSDVESLRADILNVTGVVAYYAYGNRIVDASVWSSRVPQRLHPNWAN